MSIDEEKKRKALELVREGDEIFCSQWGIDAEELRRSDGMSLSAIEKYNEALALWPECMQALVGRCILGKLIGDIEGAKRDARAALGLGPGACELSMIASTLEGEEARVVLRDGMTRTREGSIEYQLLARGVADSYFREGNFLSHARELKSLASTDLDPQDRPSVFESLGSAYRILGEFDKAEAAYRRALPESAASLIRLLMERGETEKALQTIAGFAADLEPHDVLVLGALTKVLGGLDVPEAREALEAVLEVEYITGLDGFSAGVLYRHLGEHQNARRHLERFRAINAANPKEWGVTLKWRDSVAERILGEL